MTQMQKKVKIQKTSHKWQVFHKIKKMESEIFAFCIITFEPIKRYRLIQHLKMTVWTLVLWKIFMQLTQKMARKGQKLDIY